MLIGQNYMNYEQQQGIEVINKLKCITKDQLLKMNIFKKTHTVSLEDKINIFNKYSYYKNAPQFKLIDNMYYLSLTTQNLDMDIIKAIDVMQYFPTKEIKWFAGAQYPFAISFSREAPDEEGNLYRKVFDVAILRKGEEILFSKLLDASACERLILIIDKSLALSYKEIETEKMIMYCTIDDSIKFFSTLQDVVDDNYVVLKKD